MKHTISPGNAQEHRFSRAIFLMASIVLFLPASIEAGGGRTAEPEEARDPVWVLSRGNEGDRYAAVHVIRSTDQLQVAPIASKLRDSIENQLDFSRQAAVVFFAGTRMTGGYRLNLEDFTRTEESVVLRVREEAPDSGDIVTQALTYPYIVVVVEDPPPSIVVDGP